VLSLSLAGVPLQQSGPGLVAGSDALVVLAAIPPELSYA
jgi:hypothetical protein